MRRYVYSLRYVAGPHRRVAERLEQSAGRLLREAVGADDPRAEADGSFLVVLHARLAGAEMAKHARVRLGTARHEGHRLVVPLSWHAEPAKAVFPSLEGQLELVELDRGLSQLALSGSYEVPLGVLGGAADRTVLAGLAQDTAEDLVGALAGRLERVVADDGEVVGRPGARPGLRVDDLMTPDPVVLDEGTALRSAAMLLVDLGVSGAPVVDADGRLVGVVSHSDLLAKAAPPPASASRRAAEIRERHRGRTVGEVASRDPQVTVADAALADAARQMLEADVARLVVVEGGSPVGVLTRSDVLRALVRDEAEIEQAARAAAEAHGMADRADVRVSFGEVTVTGRVAERSAAHALIEDVRAIDGVMVVVDALDWEVDDLVPPEMLPRF